MEHNPEVDWKNGILTLNRCPGDCDMLRMRELKLADNITARKTEISMDIKSKNSVKNSKGGEETLV